MKAWMNWKTAVAPPEVMRQYRVLLVDAKGVRKVETVWAPDRERAEEHALVKNPAHHLSEGG